MGSILFESFINSKVLITVFFINMTQIQKGQTSFNEERKIYLC